jgi:hypothetical protein
MIDPKRKKSKSKKTPAPTGLEAIDRLAVLNPTISDYIAGVSAYVREQAKLAEGPKKASQIRLSNALARALAYELVDRLPALQNRLTTEERKIAGGLRPVNADVSESHELDGLRLAVELKPINLAVGRAIWNRFGDIRTFAVNIHLKFPFAVVGGVLVMPIYEETGTSAAREAAEAELQQADGEDFAAEAGGDAEEYDSAPLKSARKSTIHLIERAIERLNRAGGRRSEADAAHLLEGIAVIVYDPDSATMHYSIPPSGLGLRWEEFVAALVSSYRGRFEE